MYYLFYYSCRIFAVGRKYWIKCMISSYSYIMTTLTYIFLTKNSFALRH